MMAFLLGFLIGSVLVHICHVRGGPIIYIGPDEAKFDKALFAIQTRK